MDTRLLNLHNKIVLIAKDDNLYTTSCNENSLAFLDQNCRYTTIFLIKICILRIIKKIAINHVPLVHMSLLLYRNLSASHMT